MDNRHSPLPRTEDIEESLRRCAPSPRPELRERILARCQDSVQNARPTRSARPERWARGFAHPLQQQLKVLRCGARWRVAGVGALCVLQWLVVSHFDARSQAAIHGGPPAAMWARAAPGVPPPGDAPRAEAARDWPQALQSRALLLSALMDNSDAVLWPAPPEAQSS